MSHNTTSDRAPASLSVTTGAKWDVDWTHKQQKGQTQLYLLLSSFASSAQQADTDAYCFVLASALNAGQNPALEDRKGRNALFVLCDRMAQIPLGESSLLCRHLLRTFIVYIYCAVYYGAV